MKLIKLVTTCLFICLFFNANAQYESFLVKENLGFNQKAIAEKKYKTCDFKMQKKYYEDEDYSSKKHTERFRFNPETGLVKEYEHRHDAVESTPAFHGVGEDTKRMDIFWKANVVERLEMTDITARGHKFTNTIDDSKGRITEQIGGLTEYGSDDYKTVLEYNEKGQLVLEQLYDVSGKKEKKSDYVRYEYPSKSERIKIKGEGKIRKNIIKESVHEYYNADGKIIKSVNTNDNRISGTLEESYTRTYEYDNLGRLIKFSEIPSKAARAANYTESWSIMSITVLTYTYEGDSLLPSELLETIDFNTAPGINRWYKITLYYNQF